MKKFFYRVLVVALAVGMLTPTWLTKIWVPINAMASVAAGPNNGTIFPNTGYTWTNPGNAAASDNVYATIGITSSSQTTPYHKSAGFNFSIPSGATINGIEVNFERAQTTANCFYDEAAVIMKDGINPILSSNRVTSANQYWPTTDAYKTYGGPTDLWNQTWTPAEINNGGFGFAAYARKTCAGSMRYARIDNVNISVYYSLPDPVPPVITLLGSDPYTVEAGSAYSEPGFSATDDVDGDITANVSVNTAGLNMAVPGTYTVYYDVSDAAGNPADQKTRTVIVQDTTAPSVHVTSPNGGQHFSAGQSINITWTAMDVVGLAANPINISYSVDGGVQNVIASDIENTGNYSWTTPSINSDLVKVRVTATDLSDLSPNGSDESDTNFTIDNALPNSTVSADLQGQSYGPNTWDITPVNGKISGTADDNVSGVDKVVLTILNPVGQYWNGSGWQGTATTVDAMGTISWNYPIDQVNFSEGNYVISAQAIDLSLNEQLPVSTGSFVWDKTAPDAPVVNFVSPTNQLAQVVTGTAESGSKIIVGDDEYDVAADGTFSITLDLDADEENTFSFTAKDAAGNESAPTIINIVQDSTAPATPGFAITNTGNGILVQWNLVDGADYYEVWRSSSPYILLAKVGSTTNSFLDTSAKSGSAYTYKVIAFDAAGNSSGYQEKTISVPSVITAAATTSTTSGPVATVGPSAPQNIAQEPAEIITPLPTEQGEIKGTDTEEAEESEDINWTPWIILFILIILAGAATGGYFYWFGKDDEEEIVSSEVIEKSRKTEKATPKKKAPAKKKNRW